MDGRRKLEAWIQQEDDELLYAPDGDALPPTPDEPSCPGGEDMGSASPRSWLGDRVRAMVERQIEQALEWDDQECRDLLRGAPPAAPLLGG